jgi:hypothetical protein
VSNQDDKALDDYLSGQSPESARYQRMKANEVPLELDRLVLEQSRVLRQKRPMWQLIAPSLAVAATAVLTLSIVMRDRVESPANVKSDVAAAAPPAVVPKLEASEPIPMIQSPPVDASSKLKEGEVQQPSSDVGLAESVELLRSERRSEREKKSIEANVAVAPAFAPAPKEERAAVTAIQPATTAPPVESPPISAREPEAFASASRETLEANASAARDKEVETMQRSKASDRLQDRAGSSAAAEAKKAAPARAESAPVRTRDPMGWLQEIRQLRIEGRRADADAEWKKFVAAYPTVDVPKDDPARPNTEK